MHLASQNGFITIRTFLALLLPVALFGLGVAMVGVLLYLSYPEFRPEERLRLQLWLGYLGGAGLGLGWIGLKRDHFTASSTRLFAEQQPRLFATIQAVAQQTGQTMPDEVYLVADIHIWLVEYGGFWGIGSKRALGIGLALLSVLTVDQLRGVLAHEFGHFYHRKNRLGPLVYRIRLALMYTWVGSQDKSWLGKPIFWCGRFLLHLTQAVSHRQEYVADALAVHVAGKQATVAGLQKVYSITPAFGAFIRQQSLPVAPSSLTFAASFKRYLAAPAIQEMVKTALEQQMQQTSSNCFDLHPPLAKRVAAIRSLSPMSQPRRLSYDDRPAILLLDEIGALEQALLIRASQRAISEPASPVQRQYG